MKIASKVLKISVIVILSLILVLNLNVMIQSKLYPNKVPSLFGYKPFVVTTGSMESNINKGDLIFVKVVDPSTLKVDDIVAFKDSDDRVITHRIIEKIEVDGQNCFRTKGDNNNTRDKDSACPDQIEGKYTGKIAKIGDFILLIQQPLGFIVMMTFLVIVCILIYLISNRTTIGLSEEELKEFEEFKKAKQEKQNRKKKGQQKKEPKDD